MEGLQPALQVLDLLHHLLGSVRIAPQIAVRHDPLQFGQAGGLGVDVKESSAVPGAGGRTRENGLSAARDIPLAHGRLRDEPPPFAQRGAALTLRNIGGSPRFLYPWEALRARTASFPRPGFRSTPPSRRACRRPSLCPLVRRTRASSSRFHP